VAKVPRARHRARMSAEERLGEYGNDAAWLGRRRVRRFGEKLCFPEGKAVRFEQRSCTRAFRDISPEGYRQSVDGVNRASTLRSIWTFIVGRRPLVRIRAAGASITGPGGAEPLPLPFGRANPRPIVSDRPVKVEAVTVWKTQRRNVSNRCH